MSERTDGIFIGVTIFSFFFYLGGGALAFALGSWVHSQYSDSVTLEPVVWALAGMFAVNTGLHDYMKDK